jgi:hypothetical protein
MANTSITPHVMYACPFSRLLKLDSAENVFLPEWFFEGARRSGLGAPASGGGFGEDPGQADEHEAHAGDATTHRAGEAAGRLAPAERLRDQLSLFLLTA